MAIRTLLKTGLKLLAAITVLHGIPETRSRTCAAASAGVAAGGPLGVPLLQVVFCLARRDKI